MRFYLTHIPARRKPAVCPLGGLERRQFLPLGERKKDIISIIPSPASVQG